MAAHSLYLAKLKANEREILERKLCDRQKSVCFICEDAIDFVIHKGQLEIDHVIPVAANGKDEENNFALTHVLCNRKKSATDLRVARVLSRFDKMKEEAEKTSDLGANLGHVLTSYGGQQKDLHLAVENRSVRYSLPETGSTAVQAVPLWKDDLSGMEYFFALLPLAYLHHDAAINPRGIGVNLRGLVEEFHARRPQLHVALAWWDPEAREDGAAPVQVFDGQHKAAAQILLGAKMLPVRVFVRPDRRVLLEANTNAGDKLKQVAFDAAVKRHLGSSLYRERVDDFQRLRSLQPDDLSFSEQDMVKLFKGENRQVQKYIVDNVRDGINRDPENHLTDFIEWAGKSAESPLSYSTVEKTFYAEFLYTKPLETSIGHGLERGENPRQLERAQMTRLMNLFASIFFENQWDPDLGGRKIEDKVLKGEPIPEGHLRAWRIAREEVLANVLDWVRSAIEHSFAFAATKVEKERIFQYTFSAQLWQTIENVLRNIGDLPCWVDRKLAQTIFGGKPNRDFWKKIFATGVSPTGITVLAKPLDLASLIVAKGG